MKFFITLLAGLIALSGCSGFVGKSRKTVFDDYDSEFLYWCKNDNGKPWNVFVSRPSNCTPDNVFRGDWGRFPLTVNSEEEYLTEALEAVESFNAQVGFELFRFEYTNLDPDVSVMEGRDWCYAVAKHVTVSGRDYGLIMTCPGLGRKNRSDVLLHELGHIVGLRHDRDNPKSAMFHTDGALTGALERRDVEALRRIYLGR